MRGITRVCIFCSLTTVLPTILLVLPLYLRHSLYANVVYTVAESDIMEINDGISTIFCSGHTLQMNTSFNAFRVSQRPEITSYQKHIRLKKSMTLPDDTLEYWGFYLLKGATVALSVCSRFQGASILVVKGERSLRTCGMMEHNENKKKSNKNYLPGSDQQVQVTFQTNAQIISSKESDVARETKDATSFDDPLIRNNENLSLLTDNNIVKVNDEPDPIISDKNLSKDENEESSTESNTTESGSSLDREIDLLREAAMNHIKKYSLNSNRTGKGIEKLRHMKKRLRKMNLEQQSVSLESNNKTKSEEKLQPPNGVQELYSERKRRARDLEAELNSDSESMDENNGGEEDHYREKRNQNGIKPPLLLDRGVEHGGNAINFTNFDKDSSISSFENGLLTCYDGHVLLAQQFEPSELCTNVSFLVNSKHIQTQHNVIENGYYYYIFYSDNDYVSNDMHAVFDIYKPTFQYENVSQSCINQTKCSFSLELFSGDRVIVEVPTRNGIDDTEEDLNLLTSTCHPRMAIYSIFPIAVLLLVLGCAFV